MVDVSSKPFLRSGEVASLSGVSADTLRHYERMKLLPAPRRSSGNYRMYPSETVERVQVIRRALAVGFSLNEIAQIHKVRESGGAPCRDVKRLLSEKLDRLDSQITDLIALRDHLRSVLQHWNQRLEETPNGKPARLLETLAPVPRRPVPTLKGKRQ